MTSPFEGRTLASSCTPQASSGVTTSAPWARRPCGSSTGLPDRCGHLADPPAHAQRAARLALLQLLDIRGQPLVVRLSRHLSAHGLLPDPKLHDHVVVDAVPFSELPTTKLPQLLFAAETFLSSPAHPWREQFTRFRAQQAWLADTAHFFALEGGARRDPVVAGPVPLRSREGWTRPRVPRGAGAPGGGGGGVGGGALRGPSVGPDQGSLRQRQGSKVLGDLPIWSTTTPRTSG